MCTTGVELNRIERHSNQTANKGLRHNVLRRYGSKLTARHPSIAAPPVNSPTYPLPRRCYVQRVGASQTFPGQ
jgi:hypothetical protein